jgi:hypothetical protein
MSGHLAEARVGMQGLRQIDPALRIANLADRFPLRRPEDMSAFAIRLAKSWAARLNAATAIFRATAG